MSGLEIHIWPHVALRKRWRRRTDWSDEFNYGAGGFVEGLSGGAGACVRAQRDNVGLENSVAGLCCVFA